MPAKKKASAHRNNIDSYYEDCSRYDNTATGAVVGGLGGALIGGASGGGGGGILLGGLGGAVIGGALGSASSAPERAACEERNRLRAQQGMQRNARMSVEEAYKQYLQTHKRVQIANQSNKRVQRAKPRRLPQPNRENHIPGYHIDLSEKQRRSVLRSAVMSGRDINMLIRRLNLIRNITRANVKKVNVTTGQTTIKPYTRGRAIKRAITADIKYLQAYRDRM